MFLLYFLLSRRSIFHCMGPACWSEFKIAHYDWKVLTKLFGSNRDIVLFFRRCRGSVCFSRTKKQYWHPRHIFIERYLNPNLFSYSNIKFGMKIKLCTIMQHFVISSFSFNSFMRNSNNFMGDSFKQNKIICTGVQSVISPLKFHIFFNTTTNGTTTL